MLPLTDANLNLLLRQKSATYSFCFENTNDSLTYFFELLVSKNMFPEIFEWKRWTSISKILKYFSQIFAIINVAMHLEKFQIIDKKKLPCLIVSDKNEKQEKPLLRYQHIFMQTEISGIFRYDAIPNSAHIYFYICKNGKPQQL